MFPSPIFYCDILVLRHSRGHGNKAIDVIFPGNTGFFFFFCLFVDGGATLLYFRAEHPVLFCYCFIVFSGISRICLLIGPNMAFY